MGFLKTKVDPAPWREGERGGGTSSFTRRPDLSGDTENQTVIMTCRTCSGQYTGSSCAHPTRSSTRRR